MNKRCYHRTSILWGVALLFLGFGITLAIVRWLSGRYWLKLYIDAHYVCQPDVMCHVPTPENYRLLSEFLTYASGYFAAGFAVTALLMMIFIFLIELRLSRKSRGHHEHR
ncbi:hypothetical protein NGK36_21215 [Hafnia alvei]|uniref:hypothetical protein n=1 Tax=Hafnia alvei TaxID=569 RepID=UPI002DBF0452|nr:hypothetical protein [Hafnia alvei]MEB7891785.1 hypothetical protein [Hafnia alvei]